MTTLTDEMTEKALEAFKQAIYADTPDNRDRREPTEEDKKFMLRYMRAAIEAILPELTRAARAEGCREAAACGGDTADAMVSEILARATAIENGEE